MESDLELVASERRNTIILIVIIISVMAIVIYSIYISSQIVAPIEEQPNISESLDLYVKYENTNIIPIQPEIQPEYEPNHHTMNYKFEVIVNQFRNHTGTYSCTNQTKERVKKAFNLISESLNDSLRFVETPNNSNPDITFYCEGTKTKSSTCYSPYEDCYTVYTSGQTESYNGFSTITFYGQNTYAKLNTQSINLELHEILHALGLSHSDKTYSIMYPYENFVNNIDNESLKILKELYG